MPARGGVTIDRSIPSDPYSKPPRDVYGAVVAFISRQGRKRMLLAILEQDVAPPNIGAMIGYYDPEVAALLTGEIG